MTEHLVPCFFLSPIITVLMQFNSYSYVDLCTITLSHSHEYLDWICSQSLRDLSSSTRLCKVFRMTLYFRLWDLFSECAEILTDPCVEGANVFISEFDSEFASFGRVILPWLGINVNKNMVRTLSLTFEGSAESVAKTIATQQLRLRLSEHGHSW